jgi:lipopolysaccharide export system permease protein
MMILQKYYLKEFFRLYLLLTFGLSALLSLFELLGKLEKFQDSAPSAADLLIYTLLLFPRYFFFIMPISALLSCLFTVSRASRSLEITAARAAGIKLKRLFTPFVVTGLLLSLLGFFIGEFVVPYTSFKSRTLKYEIMNSSLLPDMYVDGMIWARAEDGSFVKILYYPGDAPTVFGITVFVPAGNQIKRIINAKEGTYNSQEQTWLFKDVRSYDTVTGETLNLKTMPFKHLSPPKMFSERIKEPYEMNILELNRYINRLERSGFSDLKLYIEMHSKLSYPLINLIFMILGVAFASTRAVEGLKATALGLLMSIMYWFGFTLMLTIGYAGIMPPMIAVWLMPILFGGLAAWTYTRLDN